ncbi:MAG: sulfur carrier protein ThiS [Desulfovibrio sp.]|jgi:thiamine biosynthesis protein ThiS|nr:sulfur carrier protein ThiS [Desulfovibrio sp.]
MTGNATLILNGEEHPHAPGMTVASLVASLAQSPAGVAVEINGAILSPELFAQRQVQPGDTLEIIRFVGGG